ncbi:HAMP domain-containing protein [Pseudomonas sp. YL-218 TE3947]|uniref:HAMP domain-containing protein n=1 Tax=Pseudomonas sp. YL-218 TE3947 TaxID=3349324 RepID=UPI003D2278CC
MRATSQRWAPRFPDVIACDLHRSFPWLVDHLCRHCRLTLIRTHLDEIAAGEGDLTRRLPLVSRDELGQLAGSFNAFIDKIHSLVTQIVAMSEQLNGSVSHV